MNIVLHITLLSGKVLLSAYIPAAGGWAIMSTTIGNFEEHVEADGRVSFPSTIALTIPIPDTSRVFWIEFKP